MLSGAEERPVSAAVARFHPREFISDSSDAMVRRARMGPLADGDNRWKHDASFCERNKSAGWFRLLLLLLLLLLLSVLVILQCRWNLANERQPSQRWSLSLSLSLLRFLDVFLPRRLPLDNARSPTWNSRSRTVIDCFAREFYGLLQASRILLPTEDRVR